MTTISPADYSMRALRIMVMAVIMVITAVWAICVWPRDQRVTPGTNIESIDISLTPVTANVEQIVYSPARDGGTKVSITVSGASEEFEANISLAKSAESSAVEFFDPCTAAQARVIVGSSERAAQCAPSTVLIYGSEVRDPQAGAFDPDEAYQKAVFEIGQSEKLGYVARISQDKGYVGIVLPGIGVRYDEYATRWTEWTTYVQIPDEMEAVEWTGGNAPLRTAFESEWDLDDTAGPRAMIGDTGPKDLYAEWMVEHEINYDGFSYPSIVASGNVVAQVNENERNLLSSGILVGVLGAAVLALVTELLQPWPKSSRRQRGRHAQMI